MADGDGIGFLSLFLLVVPFAIIGGIMAGLITYDELEHHFEARRARVEAVKVGLVALAFFTMLSLLIAALAPRMFG